MTARVPIPARRDSLSLKKNSDGCFVGGGENADRLFEGEGERLR